MTKASGNGSGRTAIHIALQGKGGVGKSLISAILSQYLSSKGQDVCGIDADRVNQTFSEYGGLRVECLNLLREGSIDQREFDLLMERFLKEEGTFVVDTGASTFIPLWHYILENHALSFATEREARFHPFGDHWGAVAERYAKRLRGACRDHAGKEHRGVAKRIFWPGATGWGWVCGYGGLQEAREQAARVSGDRAANCGYLWSRYGRNDLAQTDLRRSREGIGFHDHDQAAFVSRAT